MKIGENEMEGNRVLVIIDAQNDFITGALGDIAAEAVVPNIVDLIENFKGHIIATVDTHSFDYLSTQEGKNLPIFHCLKWTWGSYIQDNIIEAIELHGKYTVVEKHTFGSPELLSAIPAWTSPPLVQEIVVVGFTTDICVVTNALLLKTYFPEILITVDASCCAGTTVERHAAALKVMRSCQIEVIND